MCVIIHRKPGISIPFDKLKSACVVNADGMGLIAIDRGKLELRKHFEKKGNDPDTLAKFLEEAKDLHVYAHLRFRTKGATDKSNVHPFGILKSKKHGIDVQFMHNGTLSDFGTAEVCDSKHFAKSFLTPLSEKLLKAVEPNQLLHDSTYCTILEKYAGRSSVFLLADNLGNHRIVNYDNGKEFEGWWASNEYSFNRSHREKDDGPTYYDYGKRRSYWTDTNWKDDKYWERDSVQTETKKVVSLPPVPNNAGGNSRPAFNDDIPFDTEEKEVKEVAKKHTINPTLPKRERFIDVAKIDDLADVTQLSMEQIKDLVDDYPEEAAMLIRDLIKELYDTDAEYDDEEEAYEAA